MNISASIKKIIFSIENFSPSMSSSVISVLRRLRFFYKKKRFLVNTKLLNRNKGSIDIHKVIYIDPSSVVYCAATNINTDRGRVMGGDWDTREMLFKETSTAAGMIDHFVNGSAWEETQHFKEIMGRINRGEIMWGCQTEGEFLAYLKRIDGLYEDMKENGYKRNTDGSCVSVYQDKQDVQFQALDEVSVSIGSDGVFLFNDGAHRLAIAQILGISQIPVLVITRHGDWVQFRAEIEQFAQDSPGGILYQWAFHPDLQDIPHGYADERWPAISKYMKARSGTVLDIGTNLAYMCYLMERDFNMDATGVEVNPNEVEIAKKIRNSLKSNYAVLEKNVFSYNKEKVIQFDVVLALNIFHHFIKREHEHSELVNFLSKLDCKEFFFETHNHQEPQMKGSYRNYSSEEFVEFVMEHTGLKSHVMIGEYENNRKLYYLS